MSSSRREASHAPLRRRKNESLISRFRRWVKHPDITLDTLWLPFARVVLAQVAQAPLTILLSGTTAGRGCMLLMASVVSRGRAIRLLWSVVKGKTGHLSQEVHCALIRRLQELIPAQAQVVVLGDGEFDGIELLSLIRTTRCEYVCGTASNILIFAQDHLFTVGNLPLRKGEAVAVEDLQMTAALWSGDADWGVGGKARATDRSDHLVDRCRCRSRALSVAISD